MNTRIVILWYGMSYNVFQYNLTDSSVVHVHLNIVAYIPLVAFQYIGYYHIVTYLIIATDILFIFVSELIRVSIPISSVT
jgi:hypothetical protein